ncbi:hypothetical protein ACWEN3_38650 [Streptomyces sp. NPDC004561]
MRRSRRGLTALAGAPASIWGTSDDDTWTIGNRTGIDSVDKYLAHSDTWAAAENNQNFRLRQGGQETERRGPAAVSAVAGPLLVPALLATVYWLYSADPSGGNDCSGLAQLLAP